MFQASKKRMQALLEIVDDMLVGAPEAEEQPAPHPHQRTVRLTIERRRGTVAPREMHCLSPVRSVAQPGRAAVASSDG